VQGYACRHLIYVSEIDVFFCYNLAAILDETHQAYKLNVDLFNTLQPPKTNL
jgi:hypothetical protein